MVICLFLLRPVNVGKSYMTVEDRQDCKCKKSKGKQVEALNYNGLTLNFIHRRHLAPLSYFKTSDSVL